MVSKVVNRISIMKLVAMFVLIMLLFGVDFILSSFVYFLWIIVLLFYFMMAFFINKAAVRIDRNISRNVLVQINNCLYLIY